MRETLMDVLIRRDGLSPEAALEAIAAAQELVREGANPEEVLADEFGLEPDYIFDLLEGI